MLDYWRELEEIKDLQTIEEMEQYLIENKKELTEEEIKKIIIKNLYIQSENLYLLEKATLEKEIEVLDKYIGDSLMGSGMVGCLTFCGGTFITLFKEDSPFDLLGLLGIGACFIGGCVVNKIIANSGLDEETSQKYSKMRQIEKDRKKLKQYYNKNYNDIWRKKSKLVEHEIESRMSQLEKLLCEDEYGNEKQLLRYI